MTAQAAPQLQAFEDSSAILTDGTALASRMKRDGYLFFKGLLDAEPVRALRRAFLECAAEAGWLLKGPPVMDALADPAAACVDPDDAFVTIVKRFYRHEGLHALKHDPAIVGLFERMFGEPVLVHPMVIPRNIFPQRPEFTTQAHQDFPHIQGTPETFSVWVPLSDCPREMGGLQVARGSHTDGVREFRVCSGAGAMEVCDPLTGRWVAGDFAAGDALIFHSMTVHKGLPNLTDRLRQSVDMRYQRLSDPVTERSLSPYSGMGTWPEIYADWPTDRYKYYWQKQHPRIAPFDWQYYERRDRMAFEMAERGDEESRASLLRIIQRDPDPAKRDKAAGLVARLDALDRPAA